MSLSINNNITSLNAWRNLKSTDTNMSKSMEKLSSGLRINRAADDPAGLVISEKMRAQLNGLDTAVKNSEKAINMVQTAEAALDKVGKLLVKIRQLAVDSANSGVNDAAMLSANQAELDEAVDSITRIANYTQFGTKKLLDGSLGGGVSKDGASSLAAEATFDLATATTSGNGDDNVTVHVTTKATKGATTVNIQNISAGAGAALSVGEGAQTLTIDGANITISEGSTLTDVVSSINNHATLSAKYTATTDADGIALTNERFGTVQDTASVTGTAVSDASSVSATTGIDVAGTITVGSAGSTAVDLDQGTGLTLASTRGDTITLNSAAMDIATLTDAGEVVGTVADNSAVFQIGANETQTVSVAVQSTKAASLGKVATYGDSDATVTKFFSLNDLTSTSDKATNSGGVLSGGTEDEIAQAIGVIDKAIEDIASLRGELGAVQSDNLQVQLDSLRVSYENLQASESTIRDTDMTREMSEFTKNQIMMQAGTAMLAQANQMPNNILQLLG